MYRDTFGRFLKQKIEYIDTCDPMPVIKIKYSTFRSRTYLYMSRRWLPLQNPTGGIIIF